MGREMSRASLVDYFIQVNYGLEGLWFDSDGEYIKCLIPLEFTNKRHFKTLLSISMEPKIQLFYCISYDLGLVDRGGQTSNSKRINMCKEEFDIIEVKSKS